MNFDDKDYNFDLFADKPLQETQELPSEFQHEIFDEDFVLSESRPNEVEDISSDSNNPMGRKKRKKKRGLVGLLIQIGIIAVVSTALSLTIIFAAVDILALGKDKDITIEIPAGSSTAEIARILHEEGAINHPMLFRIFTRFRGVDGTFQSGVWHFNNNVGYDGIIDRLQRDGAQAEQITVRIPERSNVAGMEHLNIQSIREILVEAGVVTAESFNTALQTGEFPFPWINNIPTERLPFRLEGYLFPDTYNFFENQTAQSGRVAILRMLQRLDEVFTSEHHARATELGMTMHEVLTLASIIQMEADGFHDDMPGVAAIFHNRLNSSHEYLNFLQSDPTRNYAGQGSAFDTYATPGLPPGPLVSPGIDAINAALWPDEAIFGAGYYYFVTCTRFYFHFNRTYAAHNATINQLIREGHWWEWGHRPN